MKKFMTFMSIVTALIAAVVSCQKNQLGKNEEPGIITLSLGFNGELLEEHTKAGADDGNLYGINVYYDSAKDGNINTHYAYGLFDNVEDMSVQLLTGHKYRFACTLVRNGKNILYYGQFGSNTFNGYAKPFQTSNSVSTEIKNTFIYGTTYLSGIESGTATVKTATGYEERPMPSMERFYGEVSDYSPVIGGIITIPLKKTVFGVRFYISPVPEGALAASCTITSNSYSLWNSSAGRTAYDSGTVLYSFPDVYDCWKNETNLSSDVSWGFTSSIFSQWNQSGSKKVTFKRNVLTTVSISCNPDFASGSLSFTEEEFEEDNEIYLYLNADGILVVGVKPTA